MGSGGLAEPLGKMRDNFVVLKGQMGFNNPQAEANRFSLRHELFRLRDESDAAWRQTLARYYSPNIYGDPIVAEMAKRPYGETGPEPGLVIPFGSTITRRLNYFGNPLGPGRQRVQRDAVLDQDRERRHLVRGLRHEPAEPDAAGVPAARRRGRDPAAQYGRRAALLERDRAAPAGAVSDHAGRHAGPELDPEHQRPAGQFLKIKPYADMRAYPYTDDLEPEELNTDTRLIGRSVWNTKWVLVIPGATLLADPDMGIDRFMQDVDDIYIYFQTYAYAGTMAASAEAALQRKWPRARR